VLVTDTGVAQINDFGMSRILGEQGFTTKIFHNNYFTAPELMPIKDEPSDVLPTFQSDIFSLGILFLQVCLFLILLHRLVDDISHFIVIQWT
jgi:serine/threonine protein kinase